LDPDLDVPVAECDLGPGEGLDGGAMGLARRESLDNMFGSS